MSKLDSYSSRSHLFWNCPKVKIVKNERDPPLFTDKLLIKFQNILRNTTQVIIRCKGIYKILTIGKKKKNKKNKINCMTPSGMISGKCVHKYFNLCMAHINNAISGHASGYLRSLSVETNIYCIKVSFYFLVLLYTF